MNIFAIWPANLYLRLVLVCIIVVAVHGFFVIEQPRNTHLFNYFRWQWFQEKICYVSCLIKRCYVTCMHGWLWGSGNFSCMQVYVANWWMMSYGHPTPKRQQARSNWPWVSGLDLGKLAARTMKAETKFQSTSWGLKQSVRNKFFPYNIKYCTCMI